MAACGVVVSTLVSINGGCSTLGPVTTWMGDW